MKTNEVYEVDGCKDFIPVTIDGIYDNGVLVTVINGKQKHQLVVEEVYRFPKVQEPQKVVVQKFVADWYELIKHDFYSYVEYRAWDKYETLAKNNDCIPENLAYNDFTRWYYNTKNAVQTLVNMHQFGYEVEKEKLYTVEIPNPNSKGNNKIYLCKDANTGKVYLCKGNFNPSKNKNLQLTEAEIKKDFEWAWQFAKEVN